MVRSLIFFHIFLHMQIYITYKIYTKEIRVSDYMRTCTISFKLSSSFTITISSSFSLIHFSELSANFDFYFTLCVDFLSEVNNREKDTFCLRKMLKFNKCKCKCKVYKYTHSRYFFQLIAKNKNRIK